ncbi:MAG TPA: hypothetical protein VFY84_10335 [Jiangellales bacterium]|nr:hypothetical protein [Jiangellales bacterium]
MMARVVRGEVRTTGELLITVGVCGRTAFRRVRDLGVAAAVDAHQQQLVQQLERQ